MKYSYHLTHISGKSFYIPDALSRAPIENLEPDCLNIEDIEATGIALRVVNKDNTELEQSVRELKEEQNRDDEINELRRLILNGWPDSAKQLTKRMLLYWPYRSELTIYKEIVLKGKQIVVPKSLRRKILENIHIGHLGINKCRDRANEAVFWPGMVNQITDWLNNCCTCIENKQNPSEPLMNTPLPSYPWEIVGTDIAERDGEKYLIIADYYSRYPEVICMGKDTTAGKLVKACKSAFARHGVPRIVRSDNGPPYNSKSFAEFAKNYGFEHTTSSPRFPQSNGFVERMVKTVKNIIKKSDDMYQGLLVYRSTLLSGFKFSPAELLFGRKIRTTLPMIEQNYLPRKIDHEQFKEKDEERKIEIKKNYDKRHKVINLKDMQPGNSVWITDLKRKGVIMEKDKTPRSYIVRTDLGHIRRNRRALLEIPDPELDKEKVPERENINIRSPSPLNIEIDDPIEIDQGNDQNQTQNTEEEPPGADLNEPVELDEDDLPNENAILRRSARTIRKPKRYEEGEM